jgi:hypothetical protein
MANPFKYFNSSPEMIRLTVLMYVKYPLSLRKVDDLLGLGLDVLDDRGDRLVDTALEVHRIAAGRHGLHALPHDRLRQHGRGRRAIARAVSGIRPNLANELRA